MIIIKGKGKSGKTTCLKKLIAKMLQDKRFHLYDQCKNFTLNMQNPNRDVWAKFCYGGIHIFVMSFGDSEKGIADSIQKRGNECDIIVCAAHPQHDFTKYPDINVRSFNIIEKNALKKDLESSIQQSNEKFADDLFNKLIDMAEKQRQELLKKF